MVSHVFMETSFIKMRHWKESKMPNIRGKFKVLYPLPHTYSNAYIHTHTHIPHPYLVCIFQKEHLICDHKKAMKSLCIKLNVGAETQVQSC